VHLAGRSLLQSQTLSAMEDELANLDFVRIHRSRLVNLRHVRSTQFTAAASSLSHSMTGDRSLAVVAGAASCSCRADDQATERHSSKIISMRSWPE
jgi:hypothetical protein